MAYEAVYFDGETARDNRVGVSLDPQGITFLSEDGTSRTWSFAGLTAIDAPHAGHVLRLAHDSHPGARLSVRSEEFQAQLLNLAPHLKGGFNSQKTLRAAMWIGGGLAVLAGLAYFTLNFAPQKFAVLLPDKWTQRIGTQMEASLVDSAKVCHTPQGNTALAAMIGRLAEGDPNMPPLQVHVYNIPIMNAFTLPGGHIVMTRALIEKAATPEEVAGVLAHEMGHATYHHSEAQLVRITGLQILLSVATGTSGGTNASSVAGLAAIMQSSREAEREADAYAVKTMTAAQIDPIGLANFFRKMLADEGKHSGGALSKLGTLFSTHPGTEERIGQIKPLPAGAEVKPVLTDAQWKDLQGICS
jgi:beta-barrel assembly-enhancing protease